MQQFDTVKHAQLTNATSESTENLEITLFWLHLLNYVIQNIMLGSQNGPLRRGRPCMVVRLQIKDRFSLFVE